MSKTQQKSDDGSIASIHREFNGSNFGWNGITWLIELENPVEVDVGGQRVPVDYFVASNIVKHDEQQTIIFPTNDMYRPLKHHGVVGSKGWTIKRAVKAFREWLDTPADQRARQEINPL